MSNPLNGILDMADPKDIINLGINMGKIACNDRKVYNMIMAQKEPSVGEMEYLAKKCSDVDVPINSLDDIPRCVNKLADDITCPSKNALSATATFWIMFVLCVLLVALLLTSELGIRIRDKLKRRSEARQVSQDEPSNTSFYTQENK